jgi:hypothetical protein
VIVACPSLSSARQEPFPGFRGIADEVCGVATLCCALDLHASKGFAHDHRNPLRLGGRVPQNGLKAGYGFLGLDQHLAHVDQREMLVWTAPKLSMSDVARICERVDVRLAEEATHGDRHQVERGGRNYREAWGHRSFVYLPAYRSVAIGGAKAGFEKIIPLSCEG